MRNKFRGTCYRCGKDVPAGEGHFEFSPRNRMHRLGVPFAVLQKNALVQHADCAIQWRGTDHSIWNDAPKEGLTD